MVNGVRFNPIEPDQVLNPHPWLKAARKDVPVFYMPEYDCWCVTRYEDVLAVLKDTDTFSSQKVVDPRRLPSLEHRLEGGNPIAKALVNTDPPEHTRLRKLAQKAFTPRMVSSYESTAREITNSILDSVVDDGSMNLIDVFARPLTSSVITGVIGAPIDKADDFVVWSDNIIRSMMDSPPLNPDEEVMLTDQVVTFTEWLLSFIDDRRANPRDDYISLLVHARGEDDTPALTTQEVVRIIANVIGAGLDTTSSLIGLTIFHLLDRRERWERLLAEPEMVPLAIEETLRFDEPIRGVRRDVRSDTEIGGVAIPKGSVLYVSYASAQRDESVFDRPDVYDIDRADLARHFGFGKWTHFCLGAPLARMEAKVAIEVLLDRLPDLRLAAGATPQALPSKLAAFLTGLQLEWSKASQPVAS